jgi:hypothetical protein
MENFKAIEFHQARDFSRKMNVTFEFIKQNFKPLGKCILFIAVPPILIAMLLFGSFLSDMFGLTFNSAGQTDLMEAYFLSPTFWLQMIVAMIFFLISTVMNLATINNYLVLYGEKKTNKIEVSEVWERVRSTFWMYLGTMFGFVLVAMAAMAILAIPIFMMGAISPVLSVFGVFALYGVFIYLVFGAALTFFIRLYEKKGFFDSLFRSFKLVRDKWWSTFGLIFILYLIMGISSYLFILPWYAVTVVSALHNTAIDTFQEPSMTWQIMTIIFFTLYYLAQMFLAALPNVGIAFQYFNLVELKEAKGLMHQIDSIGQAPATTATHDEDF